MQRGQSQKTRTLPMEESMKNLNSFWTWGGFYVGYRLSDALFSPGGEQLGFFAAGDEVYSCSGHYLGEVRNGDRLITNLKKKLWTRSAIAPDVQRRVPGHPNLAGRTMLVDFEDFQVAR